MNNEAGGRSSIFRQEALDEFSGRSRGDVLRLPTIKPFWFAAFTGLWLVILFTLVIALPWRDSFLLQEHAKPTSSQVEVVFFVPMHVAERLTSESPTLITDDRLRKAHVVGISDIDADSWWQRLANVSARYRLVALVMDVQGASFDRDKQATYRLKVSSSTLVDLLLFKLLGYTPASEIANESSSHSAN